MDFFKRLREHWKKTGSGIYYVPEQPLKSVNRLGEVEYSGTEIYNVLTKNGNFHRKIDLNRATAMPMENAFELLGWAKFSKDPSSASLFEDIVPGKEILNAAENLFVVYHVLAGEGIPVLRKIVSAEFYEPVKFEEDVAIRALGRMDKGVYTGTADIFISVENREIYAASMKGEYVLVQSQDVLLNRRDKKYLKD